MGCEKRNKKLFKHIAIGVLILVIIYIIVEVFFSGKKIVEGMENSDLIEYKLDVDAWTFKPEDIKEYVQAYHDIVMTKKSQEDNDQSVLIDTQKHSSDLMNKIKTGIGDSNFQLLKTAVKNDGDGEYGAMLNDEKESMGDKLLYEAKDMMKKIADLMADMEARKPKITKT